MTRKPIASSVHRTSSRSARLGAHQRTLRVPIDARIDGFPVPLGTPSSSHPAVLIIPYMCIGDLRPRHSALELLAAAGPGRPSIC